MKNLNKIAIGLSATLGIFAAVAAVHAQQAPAGMVHAMRSGTMGNMVSGMQGGMGNGMMSGPMMASNMPANHAAVQQLMTQDERNVMMEKMQQAKTPEKRQKLALANHAEMERRAKEKGIELPSMQHDHLMGKPGVGMHGMGMHGQPG